MPRTGKRLVGGGFAMVLAVAGWLAAKTASFYFGPSEQLLSATGLAPAGRVDAFAPMFPFWSDGAEKTRHIYVPPGTTIDNTDPDRWNFPEGTRMWKRFERDGVYVETRMLFKTGAEPWDWDMAVYAPLEDQSDSVKLAFSVIDAGGTEHDIPAPSDCVECHGRGETRRPLGLTAVQLPWTHPTELSISTMNDRGMLKVPMREAIRIPGDAITRAALGHLDANCGSCHRDNSTSVDSEVPLRLDLTTTTLVNVASTNLFRTAVRQEPYLDGMGTEVYVEPGKPEMSFLYRRLATRDAGIWQMPPLATEIVDVEGAALVKVWIESLD